MPIKLANLMSQIDPERTILFFGSGSSIPSGAPSVDQLIDHFAEEFKEERSDYDLSEFTAIIEQKTKNRKRLIRSLRKALDGLSPTRGLANVPLYDWRAIYTTNYDELIEEAYKGTGNELEVISSNFDFGDTENPLAPKLFKIHGTIGKDTSDGFQAPIILTTTDYDHTKDYREKIYDRLANDLNSFDVVIIGYSLSDPDLRRAIDRAAKLNSESHNGGRILVLAYQEDDNRALLMESRGLTVAYGGIDQFFEALAEQVEFKTEPKLDFEAPLSIVPKLRPVTIDVAHEVKSKKPDVSAIYNGWPAGYAEIGAGLTYARAMTDMVIEAIIDRGVLNSVVLAPSGYGKTTCARQVILRLQDHGYQCFEHAGDHELNADQWAKLAQHFADSGVKAALFIDDAHQHLHQINELVRQISEQEHPMLHLVMCSSRNLWAPRIKAAPLFKAGKEFQLKKLSGQEIDNLLNLLDRQPRIRQLVSPSFSGFSRFEKRRRLEAKCDAEPFVCLRNIFDSENFDHIILREFAELSDDLQDIYRIVAAMEDAGVRVHRQLVIRMLGIDADRVNSILTQLEGIIAEYTIDTRESVYGWKGRHPVIVGIIAEFKFFGGEKVIELLDRVIDNISPTYDIEMKTIRDICTLDNGIRRIPSKSEQNRLFQRVISLAPNERIPRHRLIRNLISMDKYEQAETEIRVFENDFRSDGAVARYKIALAVRKSRRAKGLLDEDRLAILLQMVPYARARSKRYRDNKYFLREYGNLGVEIFKRSGDASCFDDAMEVLNDAYSRLGDPEIVAMVRRFESDMRGMTRPD